MKMRKSIGLRSYWNSIKLKIGKLLLMRVSFLRFLNILKRNDKYRRSIVVNYNQKLFLNEFFRF